jgi:Methylamine dehydrogenase heavy chain (MADH).
MLRPAIGIVLFAALSGAAAAQEPLAPETLSVKATIDPGPNVYVYQESLDGPGTIAVFAADTLAMKGTMTSGSFGTMFIDRSGETAYAQSTFLKRYAYGDMESVLQIYDVATLTPTSEVILPPKAQMALSYAALLQKTADGRFMLVQNATPASSITVVDLASGTVTLEIPTPGCWGIYPWGEGAGFSTVCGDGSFMSYALAEDGASAADTTTADIFDPDADPIFATAARDEDGLVFVSFKGDVLRVADGAAGAKLTDRFSMVEGVEGGWAPSGYNLVAYSPELKRLFVTMHSGAYEGSHKNPSEELWAVDLAGRALGGRAKLEMVGSLTVGPGPAPALFALALDARLMRFDIDASSGLTLTPSGEVPLVGYPFLVAATP